MRLVGQISGNMAAIVNGAADEISASLRSGIDVASAGLLDDLRGQVRAAGLGNGLEKAWRREVYPRARKTTFHPAALVYSKSTILHEAFDRGPQIAARRSRFLVIPTAAGQRLGLGEIPSSRKGGRVPGGKKRRYADLEPFADRIGAEISSASRGGGSVRGRARRGASGARIVLVPSRGNHLVALLYARSGARPVVVATLVPTVKLARRLDIEGAEQRAETTLASFLSGV